MAIFDLFISYSSQDRPWAKKLWEDLRAKYPALRTFWDRDSIPPGDQWRGELIYALRNSKHLLVFWSDYSAASLEVGPEIDAFDAHRALTPQLEGSDRKVFFVPLKGSRGGGIADYQGFNDFQTIYDPNSADRGSAGLVVGQARDDWDRMIRKIGDAVSLADQVQEVIAVVTATTVDRVIGYMDPLRGTRVSPLVRVTLDQFLAGYKLQWTDLRGRYGPTALAWRPTGERTIVELLEEVRVRVNATLKPADHFRWRHVDLATDEGLALAKTLHTKPAVVIFDPVSLYDRFCADALRLLSRYVRDQHSVILSLSPMLTRDEDVYSAFVRDLAHPLFKDYFDPEIPPAGEFLARCALEVQREGQIDRLVRSRIGDLRIAADQAAGKATTGQR